MIKRSGGTATRGAELLEETVAAHGGIERWSRVSTISTDVHVRGLLPTWKFPGRPSADYRYRQTVALSPMRTVMHGFATPESTCVFTPEEVLVEIDGDTVDRRVNARAAFGGWGAFRRLLRWDLIDSAYFLGYAMANYLAHPYLFTQPGFRVERGADWRGDGRTWRRLHVEHPPGFASHCRHETFYIDEQGLIRRHDYTPDVFTEARILTDLLPDGALMAANFSARHTEIDGLTFPTFRRVMLAPSGRPPIPGLTMICAETTDMTVTFAPDARTGTAEPGEAAASTPSLHI